MTQDWSPCRHHQNPPLVPFFEHIEHSVLIQRTEPLLSLVAVTTVLLFVYTGDLTYIPSLPEPRGKTHWEDFPPQRVFLLNNGVAGPGQHIWSEQLAVFFTASVCLHCGSSFLCLSHLVSGLVPWGHRTKANIYLRLTWLQLWLNAFFKCWNGNFQMPLGEIRWLHLGPGDRVAQRTLCDADSSWRAELQGCEPSLQMRSPRLAAMGC